MKTRQTCIAHVNRHRPKRHAKHRPHHGLCAMLLRAAHVHKTATTSQKSQKLQAKDQVNTGQTGIPSVLDHSPRCSKCYSQSNQVHAARVRVLLNRAHSGGHHQKQRCCMDKIVASSCACPFLDAIPTALPPTLPQGARGLGCTRGGDPRAAETGGPATTAQSTGCTRPGQRWWTRRRPRSGFRQRRAPGASCSPWPTSWLSLGLQCLSE